MDPFPEDTASTGQTEPSTGHDSGPSTGETGETGGPGETGETGMTYDCSIPVEEQLAPVGEVPNARGYHGLAINADGMMLGTDTNNTLLQCDSSGEWSVFRPGLGPMEQLLKLPDGDIVASTVQTGDLLRITPEGGTSIIASGVHTYGVTLGPDGLLYVSSRRQVLRIDPVSGDQEMVVELERQQGEPRDFDFSPDHTRLYITTISGQALVLYLELDEDLDPVGDIKTFASGVGNGWMDGLAVDICGNLYVPDYVTLSLWTVDHDGSGRKLWDPPIDNRYGHGAEWGTGTHGWNRTSLFLPQPYNGNTVMEVDVGFPDRT